MKNRTWTMIEAITCAVALFLLLVVIPGHAAGDMPPPDKPAPEARELTLRVLGCNPQGICLVPAPDLAMLTASNNDNFERAEKAERELAALRAIRGCAKVEVVPPKAREILKSAPPQAGGKS